MRQFITVLDYADTSRDHLLPVRHGDRSVLAQMCKRPAGTLQCLGRRPQNCNFAQGAADVECREEEPVEVVQGIRNDVVSEGRALYPVVALCPEPCFLKVWDSSKEAFVGGVCTKTPPHASSSRPECHK